MPRGDENSKITPVYLRSSENCWIPALQLQIHNGKATVAIPKTKDEKEMFHCAKASKNFKYEENQHIELSEYPNGVLPMQNVDSNGLLEEYKDMVDLPFLHEAAILYNLKLRHQRQKPYTRTGDIVVAVNPYQWYHPLYTEDKRCYYANRLVWEQSEEDPRAVMEPHVYEVSALAYKGLTFGEAGENQSVLVSGESGAGKTETVKICLNHIASVQRGQSPPGYLRDSEHNPVVHRVVQSNPLLEAFGNAKTRRNDNSSRFGKYLQLQFDNSTVSPTTTTAMEPARRCLVGSKCNVYLLEKNRVIDHDSEERTFHIFYQLLAAPDAVKTKFWEGLRGTKNISFNYVGYSDTFAIEGKHDSESFQETLTALQLIGIKGERLTMLLQAICIVLQLGNLGFKSLEGDSDKSAVATADELEVLSNLMGLSKNKLTLAFTERTFTSGSDSYKVPLTPEAAKEACDALAKDLYQKSFLWLVAAINEATCVSERKDYGTIGLLDIFGFEVFPTNRFEQLCINYANEKLQQKFTEDIFRSVQAEYDSEGITLAEICYDDNTAVLDLIEGRAGLLDLLNEECIRPQGSDFDFVQKSLQINRQSPALQVNKWDRMSFAISHYAGIVTYDGNFFVKMNLDTLPTDLQNCAVESSNTVISAPPPSEPVAPKRKSMGNRGGGGRAQSTIVGLTVWTKYKSQLAELMSNLRMTRSRYIRCIKPNGKKQPRILEHIGTVEQLRCAGVVAGITISRSLFPNRLPTSVVLARYSNMLDTKKFRSKKTNDMPLEQKRKEDCMALMEEVLKPKESTRDGKAVQAFVVGKTRTYFRAGALEWLEANRMRGLDMQAAAIQLAVRGWLARNKCRYEKQRKEREAATKAATQKADAEREVRVKREAADRKAAHKREKKEIMARVAKLERAVKHYGRDQSTALQAAHDRAKQAKADMEVLRAGIIIQEEREIKRIAVDLTELERKLEEHMKLIMYLKKENIRARKDNARIRDKLKAEKRTRGLVDQSRRDLSENVGGAQEETIKEVTANKSMSHELDDIKISTSRVTKQVLANQDVYLAEARVRLQYQKSLAHIVKLTQEIVPNRNLVEEVVVIALCAESNAKAAMAALDMETS